MNQIAISSAEASHAETIAWSAGRLDAMGHPFSDWRLARYHPDGRVMRDADGRQVFETQAEWLARNGSPINTPAMPVQQPLFAEVA